MKRRRFLTLIIFIAFALIGSGYASWTDRLVIASTVSTGNFDVGFDANNTNLNVMEPFRANYSKYAKWNKQISNDKKTLTFTVNNFYPGAMADAWVCVKNYGSIPAVFDHATVTFDGDVDLNQKVLVPYFNMNLVDSNGIGTYVKWYSELYDWDPPMTTTLKDLETVLNTYLKNIRLEPGTFIFSEQEYYPRYEKPIGSKLVFEMSTMLPYESTNDLQNKSLCFQITLHWKQANQ